MTLYHLLVVMFFLFILCVIAVVFSTIPFVCEKTKHLILGNKNHNRYSTLVILNKNMIYS